MYFVIDGQTVFYPYGRFGRGIILDPKHLWKMDKIEDAHSFINNVVFWVALVALSFDLIPLWVYASPFLFLIVLYHIQVVFVTRGLPRSSVEFPIRQLRAGAAKEISLTRVIGKLSISVVIGALICYSALTRFKFDIVSLIIGLIACVVVVWEIIVASDLLILKIRVLKAERLERSRALD